MQVSHNNLMQARLMSGIEVFVGFDARPALVKFSDETTYAPKWTGMSVRNSIVWCCNRLVVFISPTV